MNIQDLSKSSRIAILGFGKEGRSSMSFLIRLGFSDITILDQNTDIETAALPENVSHILGVEYLDTLANFDVIIKAPGVSPYLPALTPYKDRFLSQTQIFFEFYTGKIIGITGTKGKSTVSSLVHQTLKIAGYNVKLVGNIGNPVLEEIDVLAEKNYDYIVYELSSYMLEDFTPELYIGYINNIHSCHLDWHTNIDIYTQAKYNILTNAQRTITHTDIKGGAYTFPDETGFSYKNGAFYYQETPLFKDSEIQLLGEHNRINICGVLTLLHCVIPNVETLSETLYNVLKTFHPLPHRLENIGIYNDITFIDDGIAVTPDATIAAIRSVPSLQTLLTGGKNIGMNQQKLESAIQESSIDVLILFPDTGYLLFPEYTTKQDEEVPFDFTLGKRKIQAIKTRSMEKAVHFALQHTKKKHSVLLSSAAQSYSLWKNFEEKGQQYKHYIEKHAKVG